MVNAVNPSPSTVAAAVALKSAAAPAAPPRRAEEAPAARVSVSNAGAERARQASAEADTNQDGTVSDQERQTDTAKLAVQQALLQGGPNLDEALQAYQAIASLADAQR